MLTDYPARRLMSLFRMYEAFPHDPEFVRVTALPLIKAEMTASLVRLMSFDRIGIYHFQNHAQQLYYDATASREFSVVQGLAIEMPTRENGSKSIRITWTLFFYPSLRHELEIPLTYLSQHASDELIDKAQNRLREVTALLSANDSQ